MMRSSDAAMVDASFIRLKNISLTYNISKDFIHKAKLKEASIFLQAQNLLTFTSYQGLDPESQSVNSLPPLKMMTIGLQFTF